MKVSTYKKHEEAALEVLKKKKKPVSAKQIHTEIMETHKVSTIRPSPKKLAKRLTKNPEVRVLKGRKVSLYELF
jgi:hypothetical protein